MAGFAKTSIVRYSRTEYVIYIKVFISFYRIQTYMARPKIERHKIKTSITLEPELYQWVQSKIKSKEFANLTHAVERGLTLLKEKMEGKN